MSSTRLIDKPLFIIGSPRSGTSLLRLILTSHSQILIPPECGFIIWLQKKYENWQLSDNSDHIRISEFVDDLFMSKKFDTWMLEKPDIRTEISLQNPTNYSELCAVVYTAFGVKTAKKFGIWGDKNNFYLNHLSELSGLFSGARFLHIVRDGRDVACSYREVMAANSDSPYAPKLNTNLANIAIEWSSNVSKIDLFISELLNETAMTIKYENLVKSPISTMTSVCNWLGIEFEKDMLNFHQQNLKNKLEPELTLDWKKRTLQPISGDTVGRYNNFLSDNEQAEFLLLAGAALQNFSYK